VTLLNVLLSADSALIIIMIPSLSHIRGFLSKMLYMLASLQLLLVLSSPTWKMRVVMNCHDEREVIATYVSACGVKAVK